MLSFMSPLPFLTDLVDRLNEQRLIERCWVCQQAGRATRDRGPVVDEHVLGNQFGTLDEMAVV